MPPNQKINSLMETNNINTNIFDKVSYFITSIKAVILAMTFLLVFLLIETTTLFVRQLPVDISLFWRVVASIAIAFAFEFTVLIFTANSNHNHKGLKTQHVLACFHLIINTFFWQVFEFVDWVDLSYKLFLSFLFPYLTFQYASLFEKKFREKKVDDKSSLDELNRAVAQYKSALDHLRSSYNELKSSNDKLKSSNEHLRIKNEELHQIHASLKEELLEVKSKLSRKRRNTKTKTRVNSV